MRIAFKVAFAMCMLMLFIPAIVGFVDMMCWFYADRVCTAINWTEGRACIALAFGIGGGFVALMLSI